MDNNRIAKLCYFIDTNYNERYHIGRAITGLEYTKNEKGMVVGFSGDGEKPTLLSITLDVLEKYGDMDTEEIDAIIAKDTPYRATPVGEKISMNLVFYREEDMIYNPANKDDANEIRDNADMTTDKKGKETQETS